MIFFRVYIHTHPFLCFGTFFLGGKKLAVKLQGCRGITIAMWMSSLRRFATSTGYIARAKELGRQSLLGSFHSTGERFDSILTGDLDGKYMKIQGSHLDRKPVLKYMVVISYYEIFSSLSHLLFWLEKKACC